jgi:hypothetical protein
MTAMTIAEAVQTLKAAGAFGRGIPLIPGTNIALLTKPSKMPGYSWSLPAGNARNGQPLGTCPGAVVGPGSICGSCYANAASEVTHKDGTTARRGGSYGYPVVVAAQAARREWLMGALMTKEGRGEWVAVMAAAVVWATRTGRGQGKGRRQPFFRWHDSGDTFSPAYAAMITDVCAMTTDVRHWLPTRSWHSTPRILRQLVVLNALPNVAVRPSALYFHEDPPVIPGLSAGTGASGAGFSCPSSRQRGRCDDCRRCWDKDPGAAVVYKVH